MLSDSLTLENLLNIYDNEISKNVKNKSKLYKFELHKIEYLLDIRDNLLNGKYDGGKYNLFLITKPKLRLIMSQNIYDKIINHYITRYILEPKLSKYLLKNNSATRKGMGTSYAIKMLKKFLEKNKIHNDIFVLKFELSKYFYSINHDILKQLLRKDLSKDEYLLVEKVIDSTNKNYIKKYITEVNKNGANKIPEYKDGKGIPIGNLSSQFLAIFYLSKLHKYKIEEKLNKEFDIELNKKKTYIRNIKHGIVFLGYNFKIINKKTIIKISTDTKKRIEKNLKKLNYETKNNLLSLEEEFSSIMNYKNSFIFANKYEIGKIINKIWD
ncbi:MAG: hypothetical protein PHG03_00745 [Bacilli bacterium]|nr:hypothetical protein [Bacilli bacterium]